ncbi:amidase [Prosthecomicrobium sp. N25]|uniref:amidase n=1 Tax=Prosthecomicrobium sp. N25 TaxID=3129254 RepID=UPI00307691A1
MAARIAAVEDRVHSYITLDLDGARAAAHVAETEIAAGRGRGPLHGIPFAVKDNYDAAGLPTTGGSRLLQGNVPGRDATLVARLKAAGAVLMGKLSTWEYGTGNGGEYFDLPYPPARNPWDPERFPGGSSTGAGTAVAAGTATVALGSDTTGSVRLPAAATGTVGLKSTQGLLPKTGILANCYAMDVPGPITWTVEDCALLMDVLAGRDPADPTSLAAPGADHRRGLRAGIAGLRIGVIADLGPGIPAPDADLVAAFEAGLAVLRDLGAVLVEASFPAPVADFYACTRVIGPVESATIHERELVETPGAMGFALRDKLMFGTMVRAVDYIAAQRRRRALAAAMDALMSRFDAVVTFGACHVAPRLGVEPEMTAFTTDTALVPFNISGHPCLVQCTGYGTSGLPLHWQIAGPFLAEPTILRVAAAYEAATPWRDRRPEP